MTTKDKDNSKNVEMCIKGDACPTQESEFQKPDGKKTATKKPATNKKKAAPPKAAKKDGRKRPDRPKLSIDEMEARLTELDRARLDTTPRGCWNQDVPVIDMTVAKMRDAQDMQKQQVRMLTRGYYDIQWLRIATGNRIVASIYPDLMREMDKKIAAAKAENSGEEIDEKTQKALDKAKKEKDSAMAKIMTEYHRITDYFVSEFESKGSIRKALDNLGPELAIVKTELDYRLIDTYQQLLDTETDSLRTLAKVVEEHPMWDRFFKGVTGCGHLMAAVCLSSFNVHAARWASSFWKYAGLDAVAVATDEIDENGAPVVRWEGRSKRHTELRDYEDKNGKIQQKNGLTYNPELKTKLVGVLGSSFLRVAPQGKYAMMYYTYRNRITNSPKYPGLTSGHAHRMATRFAVKAFVADLWRSWREFEGYETGLPYAEGMLGRAPHGYNAGNDPDGR